MNYKLSILLIIIAIVLILVPANTKAQKATYNRCIGGDIITLLYPGIFSVTYEQKVAPKNTFTISGYYIGYSYWAAYGIGGSYRWYLKLFDDKKKCIEGFSLGPKLILGFWHYTGEHAEFFKYGNPTSVAIGGEAAYKWVWDNFYLEPILDITINMSNMEGDFSYRSINLGANIGYAW